MASTNTKQDFVSSAKGSESRNRLEKVMSKVVKQGFSIPKSPTEKPQLGHTAPII